MADIFLSYSRSDTDLAIRYVKALEDEGWSVWYDRHIPTARKWKSNLVHELERARCVVMLWSCNAIQSVLST